MSFILDVAPTPTELKPSPPQELIFGVLQGVFLTTLMAEALASGVDDALGWEGVAILETDGLGVENGQYGGE